MVRAVSRRRMGRKLMAGESTQPAPSGGVYKSHRFYRTDFPSTVR